MCQVYWKVTENATDDRIENLTANADGVHADRSIHSVWMSAVRRNLQKVKNLGGSQ